MRYLINVGFFFLLYAIIAVADTSHPPIPIRFSLKEPGVVTIVINDAQGVRVRNLISETEFPAGENTIWWDGLNDCIQPDQAGKYSIQGTLVAPGTYSISGITRKAIDLHYEMTPYNAGNPPWPTIGIAGQHTVNPYTGTGVVPTDESTESSRGWLADHSPPSAVLSLPNN